MLHAWDIPAWINEKPYIDASYTCLCPVIEMIDAGYKQVIAINNEPGIFYLLQFSAYFYFSLLYKEIFKL